MSKESCWKKLHFDVVLYVTMDDRIPMFVVTGEEFGVLKEEPTDKEYMKVKKSVMESIQFAGLLALGPMTMGQVVFYRLMSEMEDPNLFVNRTREINAIRQFYGINLEGVARDYFAARAQYEREMKKAGVPLEDEWDLDWIPSVWQPKVSEERFKEHNDAALKLARMLVPDLQDDFDEEQMRGYATGLLVDAMMLVRKGAGDADKRPLFAGWTKEHALGGGFGGEYEEA